jgi:hypothetical protein
MLTSSQRVDTRPEAAARRAALKGPLPDGDVTHFLDAPGQHGSLDRQLLCEVLEPRSCSPVR